MGHKCSRREFAIRSALYGLGLTAGMPTLFRHAAAQAMNPNQKENERVLVVLELTGGNDGLNTVIPGSDAYYNLRPTLAIPKHKTRRITEDFGFHPVLKGLESLFGEGHLAVVHGCGYPNPSLSHFESIQFWHTGTPHDTNDRGWIGRMADSHYPTSHKNLIVNLATAQSAAVRANRHRALVFENPERVARRQDLTDGGKNPLLFKKQERERSPRSPALDYVHGVEQSITEIAGVVRETCENYKTTRSYTGGGPGLGPSLRRVAALLDARFPTRFYYLNLIGFDTHSSQTDQHALRLHLVDHALHEFYRDLERIGRIDDVTILVFTEFGRRPKENVAGGTDHGTAGPMFVLGKNVKGGFYGTHPSLTRLSEDGNLLMTTDFRSVYASLIRDWMGFEDCDELLKGRFPPVPIFG